MTQLLLMLASLIATDMHAQIQDNKDNPGDVNPLLEEWVSSIFSVAYSSDGKMLASGNWGGTVTIWKITPEGIKSWKTLPAHQGGVMSVSFSPDGKTLASGGFDKKIKLWDVEKGESHDPEGTQHEGPVMSVSFSPDGKTLASGSWDKTIKLWKVGPDVATATFIKPLKGHTETVLSVAFSPDSKTLASGGYDMTIRLWNCDKGEEIIPHIDTEVEVRTLAFRADGQFLASNGLNSMGAQAIVMRDTATYKVKARLIGHTDKIMSLAFNKEGSVLISGGANGTLKMWEGMLRKTSPHNCRGIIDKDEEEQTDREFISLEFTSPIDPSKQIPIRVVAFDPNGKTIAAGGKDPQPKWWTIQGKVITTLKAHKLGILSLAVSSDLTLLVSASWDNTIKLWDSTNGSEIVSPVKKQPTPTIDQTNSQQNKDLKDAQQHKDAVTTVAFSPDGKSLASGSYDNTIKLWEITHENLVSLNNPITLLAHQTRVNAVAYNPKDCKTLASAGDDNTINLWDIPTGKVKATLKGEPSNQPVRQTSYVSCLAFSPDGTKLAAGSWDNTINLWDLKTFKSTPLKGHTSYVTSVAFSPDGTKLASGSNDHTVIVWDLQSAAGKTFPSKHTDSVRSVAFSLDGNWLVSGSDDQMVFVWDIKKEDVIYLLILQRLP